MGSLLPTIKPGAALTLARAYQPILRGYFGAAMAYYAVMTPSHYWTQQGDALLLLASASIATVLITAGFWFALARPLGIKKLELATGAINLLVLGNVVLALHVGFHQAKLVYFIMMVMLFAFASVSMRQTLTSIAAALFALFLELFYWAPEQMMVYGFVAFAAAASAIAIAFFVRRAIIMAVSARAHADQARESAEARLIAAEMLSDEMREQSLSDSLTGLPNRRAFFRSLKACKKELRDTSRHSWLILLDLDGFKAVNDNYGHVMGDQLLKSVADRLCQSGGQHGSQKLRAFRMGGDEFHLILSVEAGGSAGEQQVEAWCAELLEKIAQVYLIEDRLIQISDSIGCYPIAPEEHDAKLAQKADYALLHAKRNGKSRVVLFRDDLAKDAAERFRIEQALRAADFSAEIELLFQPQLDLAHGNVICAEALARWNSPSIGKVSPAQFIEIAEETGMIARITVAVVEKALRVLSTWESDIPIAVNLSGHDLISDQIVDEIIALVAKSGVSPALLEFEITETAMMPDTARASANLLRLSELGHPIALDDFGTGYSNFSYLRTLPIGKLKVDRNFMDNMSDPMTEKILHSLAGMARTLDVHCLFEGIESELELLMAKRVGAQAVQGFHFGKPMLESQLAQCISERATWAELREPSDFFEPSVTGSRSKKLRSRA